MAIGEVEIGGLAADDAEEVARGDTDDGQVEAVHAHGLIQNRRGGAEAAGPVAVGEHRERVAAGRDVVG
jgi:hypothetical protein